MKLLFIIIPFLISCVSTSTNQIVNQVDTLISVTDTIPFGARKILSVYSNLGLKYVDNYIVFPDGEKIIYDDCREKSFIEKLDDCDIEDMFSFEYDTISQKPEYLNDCGRGRCEQLFKKMYGNSAAEVSKNLVKVDWFDQQIPITKINGVADTLKVIAQELSNKPHLRKYLEKASSFYWRQVRGAKRQSAHSYGIAIDINVSYSSYWLWQNKGKSETDSIIYVNKIPLEIVKVFEKHGFIWGGRWYHFDTMHFEYRPELL